MSSASVMLSFAAAATAAAILSRRQPLLLLAVAAYAATLIWVIHNAVDLVLPGIGLAIALELLGLTRLAAAPEPVPASQLVTTRHRQWQVIVPISPE
ncbi:MAG: hypothetical protein ACM33T_11250 [Solirubrobacterales bacterium]